METQSLPPKVFYTLKETPWYFGAYLNQARHNLFLVLNDLTVKLGFKPIANDDQLHSCKSISILKESIPDPILLEKAMEYYDRKLPFLFAMHYKYSNEEEKNIRKKARDKSEKFTPKPNIISDPEKYYEIMELLIKTLYKARNHFSHYSDTPFVIDRDLEYLLNDSFDVNVRIVKHRFNLDDAQIEHLRRYEDFKDPKTKKAVKKKNFRYSFTANDGSMQISEVGLAFFVAMFLPKGDAYLFLKKISGLKRDDSPEFKATVETFCVNTIWLPKERVESDNSAQAGFLDMVNELAKCPKELFEHLSLEKQAMFISENKEKEEEGLIETSDEDAEEPEQESKMVRKNNRFTFFTQRYFDIMESFPSLRFAVDLGTYYYSIYPKEIAGNNVIRQLTKHLIGYGRLEDFDKDKRPENIAGLYQEISPLNKEQTEPYIKEIYPHYHVENNVVPLYLINKEQPVYWPSINTVQTGGKSYPNKIIKDASPKPYAYISAMELPAMLFYELLRNGKEAEKLILNHIVNIKRFFQELNNDNIPPVSKELMQKPGAKEIKERTNEEYNKRFTALIEILKKYELKPQYVPDKIVEILLAIAPFNWKANAEQRLKKMIDETYWRINKMEEREKLDIKPGKKAFRKIKVGKLADLLAEDMMLMQPIVNTGGKNIISSKANTTAFRLLQSRLAYFGQYKHDIRDIFKACRLTDSENQHPFLDKISISDKLGIIEFYKAYFAEKAKYLENCFTEADYKNYHFLKAKQDKQDIQALTSAYLNLHEKKNEDYTATLLPRGLFFEKTMEWFAQNGSEAMIKYSNDFAGKSNSVHLINYYFENELKDKEQEFYKWKKSYKLFNGKSGVKEIPKYLGHEEIEERFDTFKKKIKIYKQEHDNYIASAEKIKENLPKKIASLHDSVAIKNFAKTNYGDKYPVVMGLNLDKIRPKNLQKESLKKIKKAIDESVKEREKEKKAFQYYLDNEKYLRLVSVQDKLMFMCVQKMLQTKTGDIAIKGSEGKFAEANTFQLQNIAPVNDVSNKNILDCTPVNGITMSYNFYEPDAKGILHVDKKAGTIIITDKHLKIKNAGNFKKLVRDRRLNNLCFYFKPDDKGNIEVNRMVLENELREYDKLRPSVLEKIADFEKKMYQANIKNAKELFYRKEGVQYHPKYLAEFFGKQPETDVNNLQNMLIAIRNGFVHNQYPFIKDDSFVITAVGWQTINNTFKPSEKGSTKGYGIIEKITLFANNSYRQLTDAIKLAIDA